MKGKGKSMQDKDCPLMYPDLEPIDHTTQCPKYTASRYCFLMESEQSHVNFVQILN